MSAIFKALAAAQKNFEAARKSSDNGHFKSKYADLSNCMDAIRTPCNDQGIFVTQTIESVESGVLVETVFAHESGETYVGGKLFMPVTKHDAHGYGSALTYARRYSLLAACGVAPEDDDGNDAAKNEPEKIVHTDKAEVSYEADFLPKLREAAMNGTAALAEAFKALPTEGHLKVAFWQKHQKALKSAAQAAEVAA